MVNFNEFNRFMHDQVVDQPFDHLHSVTGNILKKMILRFNGLLAMRCHNQTQKSYKPLICFI